MKRMKHIAPPKTPPPSAPTPIASTTRVNKTSSLWDLSDYRIEQTLNKIGEYKNGLKRFKGQKESALKKRTLTKKEIETIETKIQEIQDEIKVCESLVVSLRSVNDPTVKVTRIYRDDANVVEIMNRVFTDIESLLTGFKSSQSDTKKFERIELVKTDTQDVISENIYTNLLNILNMLADAPRFQLKGEEEEELTIEVGTLEPRVPTQGDSDESGSDGDW